ncbi:MAG TPA: hypothetical protein VFM98_17510 [Ramlibacter sp.]|uniref:hypothetical protein n=1 Tax=Ramlibacter sp. TaxID=1917967 RepID=UPI002D7FAF61|nr:hypothetical protein [Ramlibacter sp.]HET8747401.1 hypothetical protein [Ramlibacter sp.]
MAPLQLAIAALFSAAVAALVPFSVRATPIPLPPGEYDLTAETVLPHLEEALRYATTRSRQCLREPDATAMFPLLRHQAFAGCNLVSAGEPADGLHFTLHCANPQAATGAATFRLEANRIDAVLEIKMGGKNMTLSQRLHGPRIGACPESGPR